MAQPQQNPLVPEQIEFRTVEGFRVPLRPARVRPVHTPEAGTLSKFCMWWLRRRGFVIAMLDHRSRLVRWVHQ